MPVSDEVRERVKNRLGGACYFFHKYPHPGNQIVHLKHHQGIGGLPPEHEYNQEGNLAWGCQQCHNLFHEDVPPFQVEEFSLDPRVFKIRNSAGTLIDLRETPIWFLIEPEYQEARRQRESLEANIRTLFQMMFSVAEGFQYFRNFPERHKRAAWRRFEAFNDEPAPDGTMGGTILERWEDLPPLVGFTVTEANRYERQARWASETGSTDLVRGMEIRAIDALRKIKDGARLVELAGIARDGKPADFWAEMEQEIKRHERLTTYEIADGRVDIVRGREKDGHLVDADGKPIDVKPGQKVIRGKLIRGSAGVSEREDAEVEEEGKSDDA